MKLADLHPRFLDAGGEGVSRKNAMGEYEPAPLRTGVGVDFDCPCGCASRCYVPFKNPLDGGPLDERGWDRTGDTFETLTLLPSILRPKPRSCGWHGIITNGEVTSC